MTIQRKLGIAAALVFVGSTAAAALTPAVHKPFMCSEHGYIEVSSANRAEQLQVVTSALENEGWRCEPAPFAYAELVCSKTLPETQSDNEPLRPGIATRRIVGICLKRLDGPLGYYFEGDGAENNSAYTKAWIFLPE